MQCTKFSFLSMYICGMNKLFKYIAIFPVRVYQWTISPLLGQNCRFQPTCSHYMIEAIEEWGVFQGIWLGLKRIFRCHPWGKWGPDPVPKRPHKH
jgi:uncharacterized protein